VVVFLALLALTGLTTGVAYIDLGAFNAVAALAIAVIKMLLGDSFFYAREIQPAVDQARNRRRIFLVWIAADLHPGGRIHPKLTPVPDSWGPAIAVPAPPVH